MSFNHFLESSHFDFLGIKFSKNVDEKQRISAHLNIKSGHLSFINLQCVFWKGRGDANGRKISFIILFTTYLCRMFHFVHTVFPWGSFTIQYIHQKVIGTHTYIYINGSMLILCCDTK